MKTEIIEFKGDEVQEYADRYTVSSWKEGNTSWQYSAAKSDYSQVTACYSILLICGIVHVIAYSPFGITFDLLLALKTAHLLICIA
jgi:hypothetical protein